MEDLNQESGDLIFPSSVAHKPDAFVTQQDVHVTPTSPVNKNVPMQK